MVLAAIFSSCSPYQSFPSDLLSSRRRARSATIRARVMAGSSESRRKSTKLVTFVGKGGSGKTTASVLAAKYYAMQGLKTCLVVHSQDSSVDELLGIKVGTTLSEFCENLSVIRLETSKMLLEPLERMKKVDARLNLTQGLLEGVVGEELGVLPGMDSIFVALALQNLVNFIPRERYNSEASFDVVVYDGISSEETLRLIGATERSRSYLKYARDVAEKTDLGRLASPSLLKLVYESAILGGGSSEGKTSPEIWNNIENALERASASFLDSSKFNCYLVMDPTKPVSVKSALRYWGCAIQAGTEISGAFGIPPRTTPLKKEIPVQFFPLGFVLMPDLSTNSSLVWDAQDAKDLLFCKTTTRSSVRFDPSHKTVALFMPGFDKSEIKLYQYRGGAELLVEAGDQRRVIRLPSSMQGKVGGAKFIDRDLIVTLT